MSLAGEAIVAIWNDIEDEGRDAFYWWHVHEHMPERVGIPGFLRGRRYIGEHASPEFFTLYEALSVETLAGQDYLNRLNSPTPWTVSTVKFFANSARSIQRVRFSQGPGMGGHLLTVRFEVEEAETFVARATSQVLAPILATRGITGVHLGETNLDASGIRTKEKEGREGTIAMPGWSLLIEAARIDELDRVRQDYLSDTACGDLGIVGTAKIDVYQLEYVRTKMAHSV
ncbi:MAG: hypothetical protein AAFY56_13515 [Pseudomonadota bacterium]